MANIDNTAGKSAQRVMSLDIMKGIVILGVVLSHVVFLYYNYLPTPIGGGGSPDPSDPELLSLISDKAMSVVLDIMYAGLTSFFIITGYFFRPGRSYAKYFKTRILRLLEVYLLVVIVTTSAMYGYLRILGEPLDFGTFLSDLFYLILGKDPFQSLFLRVDENMQAIYEVTHPLYFLQALIVASIFFYATAAKVISDKRILVATISALLVLESAYLEILPYHLPFYTELVPTVLAALYLGAYLGKIDFVKKVEFGRWEGDYRALVAISILCCIVLFCLFPTRQSFIYAKFGDYGGYSVIPFFVSQVFGFIVLLFLCTQVSRVKRIGDAIAYIGRHSLSIYLLHMFFAKMLVAPFVDFNAQAWIPLPLPYSAIVAALAIAISLYVGNIAAKAESGLKAKIGSWNQSP